MLQNEVEYNTFNVLHIQYTIKYNMFDLERNGF